MSTVMFPVADGENIRIGDLVHVNAEGKLAKSSGQDQNVLGYLPPGTKIRGKFAEVPISFSAVRGRDDP